MGVEPYSVRCARDRGRQRLDRRSAGIARDLAAQVVRCPQRGYGAACAAGLRRRAAELVAFCDCDASIDPSEVVRMALPIRRGEADLVVGRRRPVSWRAWPLHARMANRGLARLTRRRTGVGLADLGADPRRASGGALALPVRIDAAGIPWRRSSARRRPAGGSAAGCRVPAASGGVESDRHGARNLAGRDRHVGDAGRMIATVVVLAKQPEPGRVKTRLVPPLNHEQAAAVAAAALRDTLDAVTAVPAGRPSARLGRCPRIVARQAWADLASYRADRRRSGHADRRCLRGRVWDGGTYRPGRHGHPAATPAAARGVRPGSV